MFDDWRALGDKESVMVSNLDPGTYQFEISGKNHRNVWVDSPGALTVKVLPDWYETKSVQIVSLLVLFSLGWLAQYVRGRRIHRRQVAEQVARFNRQREDISQDIHDAIGADFAKIGTMVRLMKPDGSTSRADEQSDLVSRLLEIAAEGSENIRRIIWASNPRKDTLGQLVDYLVNVFDRKFRHTDIQCRIDVPENVPSRSISPFLRHDVVMIVNEAANNILKHAKADEVRLRVTATDSKLEIVIEDNGRGVDSRKWDREEGGLFNMKRRAARIQAAIAFDRAPLGGMQVGVEVGLSGGDEIL